MKSIQIPKKLLLILLIGLAIRFALLWMPGTEDMYSFRMWGAQALRSGLLNVYTWKDKDTLHALFLKLRGIELHPHTTNQTDLGPSEGVPDYPPGNILMLEIAVAICKFLQGGALRAGPLLNACLNLFPVLFSLASALLIWFYLRMETGSRALVAAASFWLNPAIILTSPILGLQDPIFAFFDLLSLILFCGRKYTLSMLGLALGCLIKPQGIFVVPVLAMGLWSDAGWRTLLRYGLRFVLFLQLGVLPYVLAGKLLAPLASVVRGAIFPGLSAQEMNVWWLVGPTAQALAERSWRPLSAELQMVSGLDFSQWVGFNAQWIALPAFATFTVMNLYYLHRQLRRGNRSAMFWAAALEVYAYTMLALYVHENHLYAFFVYAAPLLARGDRVYTRFYWGLSAIYGLNLYLFDGFGQGIEAFNHWLRTLPGFDLTILVALGNVLAFGLVVGTKDWWFDRTSAAPYGHQGQPDHR